MVVSLDFFLEFGWKDTRLQMPALWEALYLQGYVGTSIDVTNALANPLVNGNQLAGD